MSVLELRQYTLHPGHRDELIGLFEREFIESQEREGARLPGLFRDFDRPDRFVWLRSFADMEARERMLRAFYGGPVWREHRNAANATMIDSDDVLLLRPVRAASGLGEEPIALPDGPLVCAIYSFERAADLDEFAVAFAAPPQARVLGTFVTERSPNTYPALPVREGENTFVGFVHGLPSSDFPRSNAHRTEFINLSPTSRSRLQVQRN